MGQPPRCAPFEEPVAGDGEVIVHVHAAALKPVDKQLASGSHYASTHALPSVCGIDGVGHLDDGSRVFFGGVRPPYGAMAERAVVRRAFTFAIPDALSDETAAAIVNPRRLGLAYARCPRKTSARRECPDPRSDRRDG